MREERKSASHSRSTATATAVALALVVLGILTAGKPIRGEDRDKFNRNGNVLIADQFNNRIIEVDADHDVIWQFGDGSYVAGPTSVVGPNDAERVGSLTLISGTGTPAGADPSCPNPDGCPDNRVMLVNNQGHIVWQYGQAGITGSGPNQLNAPVQATYLPNNHILITDQGNQRVIEVTKNHQIVWQYGMTGVIGSGFDQLNNPNSAELLDNGNVLIADESNNRVIEVNPQTLNIVWQYGDPNDTTILNAAAFASRLPNGNTLISDSGNNRILEVTPDKIVVLEYDTNNRPGSNPNPLPTRAVRLKNGHTLISDQFNDQVIELESNNQGQVIVWSEGAIDTDGNGFNQLNAPYDAKVVGDYTGLTNPHHSSGDRPEGERDK